MAYPHLEAEHPTLTSAATTALDALADWPTHLEAVPDGSIWLQHMQFAERTQRLAEHLRGVLTLADQGCYFSALALARTGLEHHLLDRLLMLADRYEEIVRPANEALLDEWEDDWKAGTEPWTKDVISVVRTKQGDALRITRNGYAVVNDDGVEVERVSPYWAAMQRYNAFASHPGSQQRTIGPFEDLDDRHRLAQQNQATWGRYFNWSSICRNLELCDLADEDEMLQLTVHYAFLSAFTHAAQTGYDIDQRLPPGPPTAHLLGELALLYSSSIASAEVDAWGQFVGRRPTLLSPLPENVTVIADRTQALTSYFWFLGGGPTEFDRFQEANRRASPGVLAGRPHGVDPRGIDMSEIGYYGDPFDRLARLHTGANELMTGFSYAPQWPTLRW